MPPKTPDQYELWADLARQNTHLRRNNWLHWCVHLVLVVALVLGSMRVLPVIRVDQLGRAELVERTSATNAPAPEEAEQVSRLISGYLLEVTSGSVARDLGKAMGLMTSKFQRAFNVQVKRDPVLPLIEKGNVRTTLEIDDQASEVKAEKDDKGNIVRYFVVLRGRLSVYRADVLTAPLLIRDAIVRVTLLAVPRTSRTLNGLLVDFFEKELVEPPRDSPSISTTPLPVSPRPILPATATP
jgi:hypothetical protein